MTRRVRTIALLSALLMSGALGIALAGQAQGSGVAAGGCGPREAGVNCGPGNNRASTGGMGTGKVPHSDEAGRRWPPISGILWQVLDNADRTKIGGLRNDELLGHHGDETLLGGGGHDILWGDWDPKGNSTKQRDTLSGGAGNDWLYPSHGRSTVRGGAGTDYVYAFYGKGTIDCGPGRDVARIRTNGAFKTRNCETIKHFCAHGSDSKGRCLSPTGKPIPTAQRWG